MGICPSPRLFAACHVLLRLQEPRHPSCALFSFLFLFELTFFWTLFLYTETLAGLNVREIVLLIYSFCFSLLRYLVDHYGLDALIIFRDIARFHHVNVLYFVS